MSTPKFKELKMQLEELLKKVCTFQSVSRWEEPIFFVKNEDGICGCEFI
jgi:hypothetical protein